jgi:hypothetical protein
VEQPSIRKLRAGEREEMGLISWAASQIDF